MKSESEKQVNTSSLKPKNEYVCWLDIMGTKNNMSDSFEKSTNYMLRFHSAIFSVVKSEKQVTFYPVMDGVYITSPKAEIIKKVVKAIMNQLADVFIEEATCFHKFVIRGALAYGEIAHGKYIDERVCKNLAGEHYLQYLLFGMPIIMAHISERLAPPYGIYIHESARKVAVLQGRYMSVYTPPKKKYYEREIVPIFRLV